MKQFVLFNEDWRPVGLCQSTLDQPAQDKLREHGATYAKLVRECSAEQYEAASRAMADARQSTASGKRQRTGSHGHPGGDGHKPMR